MIYFPFSFAPLVYHNTDIHYSIPCLYCILLLWYTDLFRKIILYSTIMIYMFPNIIAFCISQYWYTRTHMAAELYTTIMIYFFVPFLLFCISQYWYHSSSHNQIVYHNSDIRFSPTISPVLKNFRCSACETILFYSLLLWDGSITRFWLWDDPVPTVSLSIPLYLTLSVVIRFCNTQFWLGISLLFPFRTPFVSLTVLVFKSY